MSEGGLQRKVFSGLVWKFGERIGAQAVSFLVSIILARLLLPSDYGVIALITIFIDIANVFVSSGFGAALVQKKDADELDFSSVFYFSIVMSWVLYIIVFLCAPVVAGFYDKEILTPVLRVMALKLPLAGVNSVQHAYVQKKMLFKFLFFDIDRYCGIGGCGDRNGIYRFWRMGSGCTVPVQFYDGYSGALVYRPVAPCMEIFSGADEVSVQFWVEDVGI